MENASEGGQQAVDYVSKNWLRLLNAGGMGMWVKGEALGVDRSELGLLTPWITVAPCHGYSSPLVMVSLFVVSATCGQLRSKNSK